MMLWIDSVRSTRYQIVNVAARATANTAVLSSRGTPSASVRLSVISVPTMLTRTTVSQYTAGTYRRGGGCQGGGGAEAPGETTRRAPGPRPRPAGGEGGGSPRPVGGGFV